MTDQGAEKSGRNSVAAGAVTTTVVTTIILSTAGKDFTVLQSVVFGVAFGIVAGLTALVIIKFRNRSKQNS